MNINKNISVWRGNSTPPTKYHLWIKEDGTLYTHDGYQWVKMLDQIPLASYDTNGMMSKEDKLILDDINSKIPKYEKEITDEIKSLNEKDELLNEKIKEEIQRASDAEADLDNKIQKHIENKANPHNVTKTQVGLSDVTNDAQVKRSEMGIANGVATLNGSGLIPSEQLPSYVDDVIEYADRSSFPTTGESGKIYVAKATGYTYRWSGSTYIPTTEPISSETNQGLKRKSDGLYMSKHAKDLTTAHGNKILDDVVGNSYKDSEITVTADKVNIIFTDNSGNTETKSINSATDTQAGLMSAEDKSKFDNISGNTVGGENQSIYFNNGIPTATNYAFGNSSGNVAINNGILNLNLNAKMLEGKSIGNLNGDIVTYTVFPTTQLLIDQGYLRESERYNSELYFKGICKWIVANYSHGGMFIGLTLSVITEFCLIWVDNTPRVDGLPQYCSGVAYKSGYIVPFGVEMSRWYYNTCKIFATTDYAEKLKTPRQIIIGNHSELFDGSGNITYTLDNIGAASKNDLSNKVDKVNGKGLSTNDYTNEDKTKLGSLTNYDDTELTNRINNLDSTKADITDLSNVLAEEAPNQPTLQEINNITREELKKDLFIDMWKAASGTYNNDLFSMGSLTNLTYNQALNVLMLRMLNS